MADRVEHIPEGWSARTSKSRPGTVYYVNNFTGETQWELPTSAAVQPSTQQVRVRHILRKHSGSRRPASWRCAHVTQSKEESIEQIKSIIVQLQQCLETSGYHAMEAMFADIASVDSDCGSAQKGGDLGFFGPGQMQRPFEEASFALAVGGLSGVVDTDSGIHVILRIA